MKILELTNFSAGSCGVWTRVINEAKLLSKNHEIQIYSSNATKDSDKIAKDNEKIGKIKIKRFPFKKLGGESFMWWNFEEEAIKFQPQIIIAHVYRHIHTLKALKLAKKINCKVFLVTHAPFVENNSTRSIISSIAVKFYDFFIGKKIINKFDKVITIARWEVPYLKKLGLEERKKEYIPNGIPEEFFKQKKSSPENKILFLGRISPIKNLETLILSLPLVKDKKIILEIVGPSDKEYKEKLEKLAHGIRVADRIIFSEGIYNLKEKIKKIDRCKIFVLPSLREAMPQALIEAMSREKIVIASNNLGAKELIIPKKNGYLFEVGKEKDLAKKINLALSKESTGKAAKKFVETFRWKKIISKYENLFSSYNKQ